MAYSGNVARATFQFSNWLRARHPNIYSAAISRTYSARGNSLSGLAADTVAPAGDTGSFLNNVTDILKSVLPAVAGVYTAKQLIDINIERAKQGQPPIEQSAIAPQVNVGIPPAQLDAITGVGKIAIFGALGIGAMFLFLKRGKK